MSVLDSIYTSRSPTMHCTGRHSGCTPYSGAESVTGAPRSPGWKLKAQIHFPGRISGSSPRPGSGIGLSQLITHECVRCVLLCECRLILSLRRTTGTGDRILDLVGVAVTSKAFFITSQCSKCSNLPSQIDK